MSALVAVAQPLLTGLAATFVIALAGVGVIRACSRALPSLSGATRHACYFVLLCTLAVAPLLMTGAALLHRPFLDVASVIASDRTANFSSGRGPNGARVRMPVVHAVSSTTSSLIAAGPPPAHAVDLWTLGVLIWILVAALRTAMLGIAFVRVLGIKRHARPLARVGQPRMRGLRVLVHDGLTMPVAVGYLRPAIIVPRALLDEVDDEQLRQLLAHEAAHLRRYDDWTTLVERFSLALFWFNPLVGSIARCLELEREIACDEDVVTRAGATHAYAKLLWELAQRVPLGAGSALAPGAVVSASQTATRLHALLERRRAPSPGAVRRVICAVVLVCAGTLGFCAQFASVVAAPSRAQSSYTRVTLSNGDLLVLGGVAAGSYLRSAAVVDHRTLSARAVGDLVTPRAAASAALLHDGRVLITGGWTERGATAAAEIYDPRTRAFTAIGPMTYPREGHQTVTLRDGRVAILGGRVTRAAFVTTPELFDPATGKFSRTPIDEDARADASAELLPNDDVMIGDGRGPGEKVMHCTIFFNPHRQRFFDTAK